MKGFVFGGKILTYGDLAGRHSNEIHKYDLSIVRKKPVVEITTIRAQTNVLTDMGVADKFLQTGDIPNPTLGATLTVIKLGEAILIGGLIQTNINKSAGDILTQNLNIYEVKTSSSIYELSYNIERNLYNWRLKGMLNISVAFHATVFCKSLNSLIIIGGLTVQNSSIHPGERRNYDPVIVSLENYDCTHRIILNSSPLSGSSYFQVDNLFNFKKIPTT